MVFTLQAASHNFTMDLADTRQSWPMFLWLNGMRKVGSCLIMLIRMDLKDGNNVEDFLACISYSYSVPLGAWSVCSLSSKYCLLRASSVIGDIETFFLFEGGEAWTWLSW